MLESRHVPIESSPRSTAALSAPAISLPVREDSVTNALRPLTIGELLDRTFYLYRTRFELFVGIAALPNLIVARIANKTGLRPETDHGVDDFLEAVARQIRDTARFR
jgi:hypothetical protein